jgi:hypothetical protein
LGRKTIKTNPMSYPYSFKDIQKATGLKMDLIRKIYNANEDVFQPHMTRGNNNSILFNPSGLTLFDKAKQKKDSGANIPAISSYLRELSGQSNKTATHTPRNLLAKPAEESLSDPMVDLVRSAYEQALKAKDETISTQKQQIADKEANLKDLRNTMLLITNGRTPEEIKQEQEEQATKAVAADQEKTRLTQKLEQKEKEREAAEKKAQDAQVALEQEQKRVEDAKTRSELLEELHKTSWFAFARRKELQRKIDDIKL